MVGVAYLIIRCTEQMALAMRVPRQAITVYEREREEEREGGREGERERTEELKAPYTVIGGCTPLLSVPLASIQACIHQNCLNGQKKQHEITSHYGITAPSTYLVLMGALNSQTLAHRMMESSWL